MKKICEILERIEATASRNEKEKILRDNIDSNELGQVMDIVFNPYRTYGIGTVEELDTNSSIPTMDKVVETINNLEKRLITGDIAKKVVTDIVSCKDTLVRKWLIRIFEKNLRAGISIATINKVWKNLIPVFEIGLCEKIDLEGIDWNEGWIIEPKIDGLRCIAIYDAISGGCSFVSRNSKSVYGTGIIEKELLGLCKGKESLVFDGELYAGNWNDTVKIVHTKIKNIDISKLVYYIFDTVSLEDWKRKGSKDLNFRKGKLVDIKSSSIKSVSFQAVSTGEQAIHYHYNNLERGFEGSVVKRLLSKYPYGRSKDWLKWKSEETFDLEIVDYTEGNGKNIGKLGAFICNYNGVSISVGGGYSDVLRNKFWEERANMRGKIIEVKGQEVTRDGSIRFPVFVRIREDR